MQVLSSILHFIVVMLMALVILQFQIMDYSLFAYSILVLHLPITEHVHLSIKVTNHSHTSVVEESQVWRVCGI